MSNTNSFEATFGGDGRSPRTQSLQQELGTHWRACGINSELAPLKTVLLHSPGDELAASLDDYDAVQMLEPLDVPKAQAQHDDIAAAYKKLGVDVFLWIRRDRFVRIRCLSPTSWLQHLKGPFLPDPLLRFGQVKSVG